MPSSIRVVHWVGVALVVHVQRTAAVLQGAVVDHGDALGGDALADHAGIRGTLAVEVAFQAVADRFVQQHAGPARSEHDGHRTGRGRTRFQVDQRRLHGFAGVFVEQLVAEVAVVVAAAAARGTHLAPAVLLGDDGDGHAHQRTDVGRQHAVAAHHQHDVVFAGQAGHHLHHARVLGARDLFDALEQGHLGGGVERSQRIVAAGRANGRRSAAPGWPP
jgi:hypothetical protein